MPADQRKHSDDENTDSGKENETESKKLETKNINTATEKELASLPMLSEQRAKSIIDHREAHGPFADMDDVASVAGIGQQLASMLKQHFHCSPVDKQAERD